MKFYWIAIGTILMLSTPFAISSIGVPKELAKYSFMLWFILPGIYYGLTKRNPLLSTKTPRRYDRYEH